MISQLFKRLFLGKAALVVLAVALVLVLAACGSSDEASEGEGSEATLAIEHFSVIEGTTWSGAHDRAGKRIAEKYPNVDYVFREEVGPDLTVPYAEELIADGADIVIGNAEFMGLPLADIADKYPDVYFGSIIASDLSTKRNFIRLIPPTISGALPGRAHRRCSNRDRQHRHRLGLPLRSGHPAAERLHPGRAGCRRDARERYSIST